MDTGCVVVGGGPAGMLAGVLLARAGVEVVVLEKHTDFLRDFRGDTIHPSTLDLLDELGVLERFLELPHTKAPQIGINVGGRTFNLLDFRHLPTVCKFLVIMPQWDFLNFIAERATEYPNFTLLMGTQATETLTEGDRVVGVRAHGPDGDIVLRSDLVIAADGRDSTIRRAAGDVPTKLSAAMDVLWWRLPKGEAAGPTLGYLSRGHIMLAIDRGDYYQCGSIIPKNSFDAVKAQGLQHFQDQIAQTAPVLSSSVDALTDWDQVKLLSVQINRFKQWYRPGLLYIGDAAHAMSPAGGVGVNYAIQDAVSAANFVAEKLRDGRLELADLKRVQKRRYWPVALMQAMQAAQAKQLVSLTDHDRGDPVRLLAFAAGLAPLKRLMGRLVGLGLRREHVRSPLRAR